MGVKFICFLFFSFFMLTIFVSLALADEKYLQILGEASSPLERIEFIKDFSCGQKSTEEKGLRECYDLGKNLFATRNITEDRCTLYLAQGKESSFQYLGSISSCMKDLLIPVAQGKEGISQYNLLVIP